MALCRAGHAPGIWARDPEAVRAINETRSNPARLPGAAIDGRVRAVGDIAEVAGADVLLLAVPAQSLGAALSPLAGRLPPATALVVCAKGIEQGTARLMSEVVAEPFPDNPVFVLSGPSFAAEVAAGRPTAVTLAGPDLASAAALAADLGSERFRPYAGDDVVGAQIGGAVKNVLAIACGISDGRGFGDNARAALVTRGLAELTRLCVARGGRADTMTGLSGLGDLALTCASRQSRNYSLGAALGEGRPPAGAPAGAPAGRGALAEGVYTAAAARSLAAGLGVEAPIIEAVDAVLNAGAGIDEVIGGLLARPLRPEAG